MAVHFDIQCVKEAIRANIGLSLAIKTDITLERAGLYQMSFNLGDFLHRDIRSVSYVFVSIFYD